MAVTALVGSPEMNLFRMIKEIGAEANIAAVYDAGSRKSYNGVGNLWRDLTPAHNDFFIGTSATPGATDPTFSGTGTIGGLSEDEYFDLGSPANSAWFQEASGLTFADTWHHNNAKFTWFGIFRKGNVLIDAFATDIFIGGDPHPNGIRIILNGANFTFDVRNGVNFLPIMQANWNGVVPTDNSWFFAGITQDEAVGADGCNVYINTSTDSFTSTYASPSATPPNSVYTMGLVGTNAVNKDMMMAAAANRIWSPTEMADVFNIIKAERVPGLP